MQIDIDSETVSEAFEYMCSHVNGCDNECDKCPIDYLNTKNAEAFKEYMNELRHKRQ